MDKDTTIPFTNPAYRDESSEPAREGAQRNIRRAGDREELLAFYDFPATHRRSLRTTNPIESTFATIRLRTAKTRNRLSEKTALSLAHQLAMSAEKRWRWLRGFHHLPR